MLIATWCICRVLVTLDAERKDYAVPGEAIPASTMASVHPPLQCHRYNMETSNHNNKLVFTILFGPMPLYLLC